MGRRCLICDGAGDAKFRYRFKIVKEAAGIKLVKTPFQAPNANAFAEAWVATVRRECLNHLACFSLCHLDYIVQAYTKFYNEARPHQRMGNRVLRFDDDPPPRSRHSIGLLGTIGCRSRLGGLLKHYYRQAA